MSTSDYTIKQVIKILRNKHDNKIIMYFLDPSGNSISELMIDVFNYLQNKNRQQFYNLIKYDINFVKKHYNKDGLTLLDNFIIRDTKYYHEFKDHINNKIVLSKLHHPTVIKSNGTLEWYKHDKLHREDGPAIERINGDKEWWLNGQRHRTNGPAIYNSEYADGTKEWWLNGERHREDGPAIIDKYGHKEWWLNGQRHREYGPAIIRSGCTIWYKNGQYHCENGPAMEFSDGSTKWYLNGKLHREDGPAVEWITGKNRWFLNGIEYTELEFNIQQYLQNLPKRL